MPTRPDGVHEALQDPARPARRPACERQRNLRAAAPVGLGLRGERRTGRAQARGTPAEGVTVTVTLDPTSG